MAEVTSCYDKTEVESGPKARRKRSVFDCFVNSQTKLMIWPGCTTIRCRYDMVYVSGEASPTFGHANANFSVFIYRIRSQFLKK